MLGWAFSSHRFSKGFSSIWCSLSSTSRFVFPQDHHRPRDASSDLAHCSRFSRSAIKNHSFLAPYIATIGVSVRGSPLLLNKWESPSSHSEWFRLQGPCLAPSLTNGSRLQGVPPLHSEWFRFKGSPSPSGWDSPQGVSPPFFSEWDSLQGGPLLQVNGFTSRASPSPQRMDSLHGGPLLQRMGFASWRSPPIQGVPFSKWMGFTSRGSPSPKRMGFASWGSPLSRGSPSPSEWDSPQGAPPLHSEWDLLQGSPLLQSEWDLPPGDSPFPGGPLLQVNEIHLKGLPLSTANGIRFKGVPFSKANGIRLRMRVASRGFPLSNANGIRFKGVPFSKANGIRFKGFPLSTATVFRFKEPCFISTSALIPCFVCGYPLWETPFAVFSYHTFSLPKAMRKLMNPLWQPRLRLWLIISSKASRMPRSHLTILRQDLSRSYRRCDSLGIAFGLVPYDVRCLLWHSTEIRSSH